MVTDLAEGGVVVAGVGLGVRLLLPVGVARGLPGILSTPSSPATPAIRLCSLIFWSDSD